MDLKIFTDNIEEQAVGQIYTLLAQPAFKDAKVRIMPDVHAGAGCVIGFTADLGDKVIPNIVGVDIGCLDRDTEILTTKGWVKISEYENDEILVYDKNNDSAFFEKPLAYIIKPCSEFCYYKNSKTLDQMVSSEHRMLVYKGYKGRGFASMVCEPDELDSLYLESGYYNFKTSFSLNGEGLPYTDNQIRILAMIQADGCLCGGTRIVLHFKKQRKIDRAIELLNKENVQYKTSPGNNGSIYISFSSSMFHTKDLTQFYRANKHQLEVLSEESLVWDGHVGYRSFYSTTDKRNADVIQFAFAANDIRASIFTKKYNDHSNWKTSYEVIKTKNPYVNYSCHSMKVPSADGKKYCFTTSTGFFVARRNNHMFITGNCGMHVVEFGKVDINVAELDAFIHNNIPSGFAVNSKAQCDFDLTELKCYETLENKNRLILGIGSLGGGNHFIEVDEDPDGNKYLVIHTGSRNLGKQVACIYQDMAIAYCRNMERPVVEAKIAELKAQGRQMEIGPAIAKIHEDFKKYSVPKELCYLEGDLREQYLHDMRLCQLYAVYNRYAIADKIKKFLNLKEEVEWECIHNYIDNENMVRKRAIAAHKDQKVIIPLNMRDGSIIGYGKGNPDWNESGPHGAGRLMSRGDAKRALSMDEFKDSMQGIYSTTVNESTIDEAPMAYKPAQEIIDAIGDTVEIETIIKPIYNFKAAEDAAPWQND